MLFQEIDDWRGGRKHYFLSYLKTFYLSPLFFAFFGGDEEDTLENRLNLTREKEIELIRQSIASIDSWDH